MQIETLKMFCDVVRLKSFSLAAERNNVTQSTVSQAVNNLEKHFKVILIDRSQRNWKMTPEGDIFYKGCKEIVEKYTRLEIDVKELHEKVRSIVRISSIYSVGLRHMGRYINDFSIQYPEADVHIDYRHPDKVYESVLNYEVDIGIVSFPKSGKEINVIPWQSEKMVIVCHPQHPLAKHKTISIKSIQGERFVAFDKGLVIRNKVDKFLKDHKVFVDVILEFDNIEAIKRALEATHGISVLPKPTLDKEVETGTLHSIEIKDAEFFRPLGIIHQKNKKYNQMVVNFIEFLKNIKLREIL